MKQNNFIKNIEKLVDPIEVGSLHFIQYFNGLLPKFIQKKLVESSSKKTPYMGFVVEPYSYFLCYEIKNIEKAKELLPDNFELIKTKIFEDDEPKYYSIFGCINTHTSAFWGLRVEFYIIAKNKNTNLLSWLIIDYDTNTISYDKKKGLCKPNSSKSIITTNYDGTLFVDVASDKRKLVFDSDIKKGVMTKLDERLWLEGNLSIGYGKNISKKGEVFSLKFDSQEVEKALNIPANSINIESNTWYPGLFEDKPSRLVCFPYAQHYISDSPGFSSNLKNKKELETAINKIDFSKIKVFSTKSIKIMFILGMLLSFTITTILIILLLVK